MHPMNLLTLAIRTLLISTPDRNVSKGIHLPKQGPRCVHDEWKKKGEMNEGKTSHLERLIMTEKDLGEKRREIKEEKGRDAG